MATPLFAALILRTRISRLTWAAVLLATAGLGVLTLDGFSIGYGEALTFVAAMLYALHIVGLGAWSRPGEAARHVDPADHGDLRGVPGGHRPRRDGAPRPGSDWLSIVYMALAAGALAMLAQTWAQAHLSPTRTAIVMSMEPVFAAFFAVLLGGESLTGRMLFGGAMVLAAMLFVELRPAAETGG